MSSSAPQTSRTPLWRRKLEDLFGLDVRSLAVLRIGVAIMLLWDVYVRYQFLGAFYTDEGVLPRSLLPTNNPISIHVLDGSALFQAILFYLQGLVALALLIGWQTRYVTVLAWFLTLSLSTRNPIIVHGGDMLLRALLFWAMFVPWGACYSVDSLSRPTPPRRVLSMGTAALILQICFLYWFTALHKWDPVWRTDGYAVFMALNVGHFATRWGEMLLPYHDLLTFMTFFTLIQEGLVPFLLFVPWRTWAFRLLVIGSFVGFHAGLAICMEVGTFEPLCMIAWLGLLPTEFWDWLLARLRRPAREGLRLVYDPSSGPAWEGVRFWTTLLMLRDIEVRPAREEDGTLQRAGKEGSWLAIDRDHKVRAGGEALLWLLRASPVFWPLRPLAERLPRGWLAWLAGIRKARTDGKADPSPPPERPSLVGPLLPLTNVALAFLVLYVFAWNLMTLTQPRNGQKYYAAFRVERVSECNPVMDGLLALRDWLSPNFKKILPLGYALGLEQDWSLFAPYPSTLHGWYVIVGTCKDGTKVDLFTYLMDNGREVVFENDEQAAKRPLRISEVYPDTRWRKYLTNIDRLDPPAFHLRQYFAAYLCDLWNDNHPVQPGEPNKQLTKVVIWLMSETTQPDYAPCKRQSVHLCTLDVQAREKHLWVQAVQAVASSATPNLAHGLTQLLAVKRFQDTYVLPDNLRDPRAADLSMEVRGFTLQ